MTSIGMTICGGGGSTGTHLLAGLLHGIEDIRCGPEINITHHREFFDRSTIRHSLFLSLIGKNKRIVTKTKSGARYEILPSRILDNRSFYGLEPDVLFDIFEHCMSFEDLIRSIKRRTRELFDWPTDFHWFEHSPRNSICAVEFLETFPSESFIHLVRDGRDAMASQAKRFQSSHREIRSFEEALDVACQLWCLTQSGALRAEKHPRYLRIRYEDLVTNTQRTLNSVLRHLGCSSISGPELREHRSNSVAEFGFTRQPGWRQNLRGPIDGSSIARWRDELNRDNLDQLERTQPRFGLDWALPFATLQQRLGYGW